MPGKDDFTFDDNDDFPETDLSSAFAEGEHEAPVLAPEEPAPKQKRGRGGKSRNGGGSKSRIVLLVLLLVVAGGAGVYYFMDLGGTTPVAPQNPAPIKKVVALPPKPAPGSAQQLTKPTDLQPAQQTVPAPAKVEPEQVKVVVAVPPPASVPESAQEATSTPPLPVVESASVVEVVTSSKPETIPVATTDVVKQQPESLPVPAPQPVTQSAPIQGKAAAATGLYALDAGSYLLDSNRDILVKKIKKLGYEPRITPVDATLAMTRLRLGSFPEAEAQEALTFARTIEPAAFSVRDGDRYIIYAGTYLMSNSVEKLKQRFQQEGIQAEAVPVKVVRTLSRIHFGGFASKADAAAVAHEAEVAGFKTEIFKVK